MTEIRSQEERVFSNLFRVIEIISDRAELQTQAVGSQRRCSGLFHYVSIVAGSYRIVTPIVASAVIGLQQEVHGF